MYPEISPWYPGEMEIGPEGGASTDALLAAVAEVPPEAAVIPAGTLLADRFRIEGKLGAGGMGVVYRARDLRLARDVAIKVLLDDSAAGQQRLLREATAMAQLAHPNVVTAHDVGTWTHGVFVAMELVEGQTLRRWLEARPRTWREVRDVFVAAGEGLLAMHDAGLVHRDFKPGNVLVDERGRVRVSDFGLVRSALDADEAAATPEILAGTMTSGSGTPGYMAPEQLEGRAVDQRADQFAFCVALDAALPRGAPAVIRAASRRGRSPDPAARFPSMRPLLARLRHDPARALTRVALAAALVGLAGLAALGFSRGNVAACDVTSAWDARSRDAVRAAFERSGRAHAGDSFARVSRALDAQSGRLASVARALCEAPVQASQACLDRHREGLAALVNVLAEADGAVVDRGVQAVAGLADPELCRDVRRVQDEVLPDDGERRAAIGRLEPRLAALVALETTGRYAEAREQAPAIVEEARRIGWAPLVARALSAHAAILVDLRDDAAAAVLREAWLSAARAGDDELAAVNVGRLIWFLGVHQAKPAEAEPLFAAGEAALARAGDRPLARAILRQQLGDVLIARGSYDAARRLHLESILLGDGAGELAHRRALGWNSLAVANRRAGLLAEAEHASRHAVSLTVMALGPQHPQVGGTLMNLAAVLRERGRHDEAVAELLRAEEVLSGVHGRESLPVAMAANNLAESYFRLGRLEDALVSAERALAVKEKVMAAGHPSIANTQLLRGRILAASGRGDEGLAAAERALATLRERLGPTHDDTVGAYLVIAAAHASVGRTAEARAALTRASPTARDYQHILAEVERLERSPARP
jgi:tetratricopeptide (TPR) repeat protein